MSSNPHQKRRVQENLLRLPKRNPVLLPILGEIALIPIESGALSQAIPQVHTD